MLPVVSVPAKNEQARLPGLIDALARQTVHARLEAPMPVILVLNNTDDGSGDVAREAAKAAENVLRLIVVDVRFSPGRAHVGSARRMAMDAAARAAPCGLVLTTDADAVPADDWVQSNLRAIRAGVDIVGGRIVGDPFEEIRLGPGFQRRARAHARYAELRDELASVLDPLGYDPWPRHHDHTGASLAVRSDVYRAVGGLDPLAYREDVAFVAKVRAAGFRLRHPPDVTVTVSARTCGRARGGMADCLKVWMQAEARGAPVLVECPIAVENRLTRRRELRGLQGAPNDVILRKLRAWGMIGRGAGGDGQLVSIPALIERFAADDLDAVGTAPAEMAIAALERRIAVLKERAHAA